MVKSVEKKRSTADQFAVKCKTETLCWTQRLSKEEHGIDEDRVLVLLDDKVAVEKQINTVELLVYP
jgi:hypothetical protein